jgi:transcriptional regulator with XRE-family HTH domain
MTMANLLKRLREERGLSQAALARESGLPSDTIRALEQSRNADPRFSTVIKLARALHVSIDDLAAESLEGPAPKKRATTKQKKGGK